EDDDVVRLGLAEEVAFLAVEGGIDGVAGVGQRRDQLAIEIAIVLDDQDAQDTPPRVDGVGPPVHGLTGSDPSRQGSAQYATVMARGLTPISSGIIQGVPASPLAGRGAVT